MSKRKNTTIFLCVMLSFLFCSVRILADASPEADASSDLEVVEASSTDTASRTIYLDSSSSQSADIPDTMYYALHKSSDKRSVKNDLSGKMEHLDPYTINGHTFSHVFSVSVPDGYDQVKFCSESLKSSKAYYRGKSTNLLSIPDDAKTNCFYLDNEDPSKYESQLRGGYWDAPFSIRNPEKAEKAKGIEELVTILSGSKSESSDIEYVTSNLYDYYTDQELNGIPRTDASVSYPSFRGWYPFRVLDMALSDEYRKSGGIALYTGHFQPDIYTGENFSEIANTMNLAGWDDRNAFLSTNNSTLDVNGEQSDENYAAAAQGLVFSELKNGTLMDSSGKASLPYFNEDFLLGNNSKNAVLGKTYQDVAFPFHKSVENGITRYSFDANKDHVHLMQAPDGSLFLGNPDPENDTPEWSKNQDSSGNTLDTYGFFPFNDTGIYGNTGKYNYGFGMRLGFDFSVPESGTFTDDSGNTEPVTFSFSGDDDVWIFIDGKLVLDVGGDHGAASGTINFADKTSTVSCVKASEGDRDAMLGEKTDSFELSSSETHHLDMFYMERGMWESNLKVEYTVVPKSCRMKIKKTFENLEGKEDISFGISGPEDFQKTYPLSSFTKKDDGSYELSLTNLPCGTYTVTERNADADGYERKTYWNGTSGDSYEIEGTDGQEAVIDVVNYYIPPVKFTVHKNVDGSPAETDTFSFTAEEKTEEGWKTVQTVENKGPEAEFSFAFTPSGESALYRIREEKGVDSFFYDETIHYVKVEVKDSDRDDVKYPGTVSFYKDESCTESEEGVTFRNISKGRLVLTKEFMGNLPEEEKEKLAFTVTGPDDFTQTIPFTDFTEEDGTYSYSMDVPAGTYHVTEDSSLVKGYDIVTEDVEGDVVRGQDTEFTIQNTVTPHASLIIRKNFSGDVVPESVKEKIAFTVTNLSTDEKIMVPYTDFKEDGTYTLYSLDDGEYEVKENHQDLKDYTHTVTYSLAEGKVTVKNDTMPEITVTNRYERKTPLPLTGMSGPEGGILTGSILGMVSACILVFRKKYTMH